MTGVVGVNCAPSYVTCKLPSLSPDLPIWSLPVLIMTPGGKASPSASVNVSPGPTSPDRTPQLAPSVTPIPLDGSWTFGADPLSTFALNFRRVEPEAGVGTMDPVVSWLHGVPTAIPWVNNGVPILLRTVSDPARSVNTIVSVP